MNRSATQGAASPELAGSSSSEILPSTWDAGNWRRRQKASGLISTHSGRWVQVAYVLTDAFFVCVNALVVFSIRFLELGLRQLLRPGSADLAGALPFRAYLGFLMLYTALIVLCCQSQDLYRTPRSRSVLDESIAVARAVILATLLLAVFIYLSNVKVISRLVVGCAGLLNLVSLSGWRLWKRQIVERRVCEGLGVRNVLIIGAGRVGQELARCLQENKQLGLVVKGFLDEDHSADRLMLGRVEDLPQVARAQFIDEVFITIPSQKELVREVALECRRSRLNMKVVPELYDGLGWRAPIEQLGGFPILALHSEPIPALGLFFKRALDIACSLLGLLLLAPLFAAIAAAIKLDSSGPVFYRSARAGRKGRRFVCCKFRTMVSNSDELKPMLRHLNERQGPFFKIANDPRLTRLGRFLRKYSFDELPQLWNVARGEMSLVGPRPHPTDDYDQYSLEHLRRLDVTPGITGLWQVTARHDPSFEKSLALDLEYIENWDLWLDTKILLRTIPIVLNGSGS